MKIDFWIHYRPRSCKQCWGENFQSNNLRNYSCAVIYPAHIAKTLKIPKKPNKKQENLLIKEIIHTCNHETLHTLIHSGSPCAVRRTRREHIAIDKLIGGGW